MDNAHIAQQLLDAAALLEIDGANPFRTQAYRNAATSVEDHPVPLAEMVARDEDLTTLDFVGKDLATSLRRLVEEGQLPVLVELSRKVPLTLLEILRVPGIGPKTAARLWRALDVADLASLEAAARAGHIAALDGFGAKTEANVLRRIERYRERQNGS